MAVLSPVPRQQFFDMDGRPLAGGKLYSYQANTTTAQATYTTKAATVANPNPVILDAGGYVPATGVWLGATYSYKLMLTDASGNTMWTIDDIQGSGAGGTQVVSVDNIAALRALTGGSAYAVIVAGYTTPGDQGGGIFLWQAASTTTDDKGINIKSTDTATGRWMRQFDGAVDIRWFGALADGATDAHTAIGYADAYASDTGHPELLPIKICAGLYKLTATINPVSQVIMEPSACLDWTGYNINPQLKPIIEENDYTVHFVPQGIAYYPQLTCDYVRPEWFTSEDLAYAIVSIVSTGGIVRLRNRGYACTAATTFSSEIGLSIIGDNAPTRVGTSYQYGSYITRGAADLTFTGCHNLHIENVGFTGAGGNALIISSCYDVSLRNVLTVTTGIGCKITDVYNLYADGIKTYLGTTGLYLSVTNSMLSNIHGFGHTTMAIDMVNTDTIHMADTVITNVLIEAALPNCTNDKGIRFDNSAATTTNNHLINVTINGVVTHGITPVITIAGASTAGTASIKNITVQGIKSDVVTSTLVKTVFTNLYDQTTCKFGEAGEIGNGDTWDGFYAGLIARDNLYFAKNLEVLKKYHGSTTTSADPCDLTDYVAWATRDIAFPTTSTANAVVSLTNVGTINGPDYSILKKVACTVITDVGACGTLACKFTKSGDTVHWMGKLTVTTGGGSYYEITVPAAYAWHADIINDFGDVTNPGSMWWPCTLRAMSTRDGDSTPPVLPSVNIGGFFPGVICINNGDYTKFKILPPTTVVGNTLQGYIPMTVANGDIFAWAITYKSNK